MQTENQHESALQVRLHVIKFHRCYSICGLNNLHYPEIYYNYSEIIWWRP